MSVFIGTPVGPYHTYCLRNFVRGVNSLENEGVEHYIVSEDEEVLNTLRSLEFEHPTEIRRVNEDVLPSLEGRSERLYGKEGAEQFNRIISIRNALRDEFLESGHDHFFSLESDNLLRPDTLTKLLEMDKDVAIGIYIMPRNPQNTCLFRGIEGGNVTSQFGVDEIEERRKVAGGGIGCTLIKKEVLEEVEFRSVDGETCDDVGFSLDVRGKGFEIWADPEIRVGHVRTEGVYTGWGEFIESR